MRKFSTGAIRDDDKNKINYEKGLSPLVLEAYGEFMRGNNMMPDGSYRDEGNWKKGFTKQSYMESKWRHFMTTWMIHDEFIEDPTCAKIIKSLCAELFNTMGYLHVVLLERRIATAKSEGRKIAEAMYAVISKTYKKVQRKNKRKKLWNILKIWK
jgi:hypothetical protein